MENLVIMLYVYDNGKVNKLLAFGERGNGFFTKTRSIILMKAERCSKIQ